MSSLNLNEYMKSLFREELEEKWELFVGTPVPKHLKRPYLRKEIEWRMKYGPLSKETQKHIDKLVSQYEKTRAVTVEDVKKTKKQEFAVGTKFIREYKSVKHEVTVVKNGYSYNGEVYKSISAVARAITGTGWNGKRFFGVVK